MKKKKILTILIYMTNIIILAAGKGTRMKSETPKVLNLVSGKPIIHHLLDSVSKSKIIKKPIIIVSPENQEQIKKGLKNYPYSFIVQKQQLGTGHAVASVFENNIKLKENLMVLYGDHPCYSSSTLQKLNKKHQDSKSLVTMATTIVPKFQDGFACFYGFGRIKRNSANQIIGIIEKTDTTEQEKQIKEVNPGLYVFNTQWLKQNIGKIKMNEKKKEYYLTDIIGLAVKQGAKINSLAVPPEECFGINTLEDLRHAENMVKRT